MVEKEARKNGVMIYQSKSGAIELKYDKGKETILANLNKIARLFGVQKAAVSKHLKNIFKTEELSEEATVSKMETVQIEGKRKVRRSVEMYNIDAIIAVGYRINSKEATQFRIWATKILKDHLLKGYTFNEKCLLETQSKFNELQETISFLREKSSHKLLTGQEKEVLNLLENYSKTLSLLEKYDKEKLSLAKKGKAKFVVDYKKTKDVIFEIKQSLMARKEASELFGQENSDKLKAILGNIYQTFGRKELYSSAEEKAAHLLYFVIKDHPFVDGNKRIGSFLFVYFLDKNNYLHKKSGERKINDNALTALSLLIAVSHPQEKDKLIKIISNLLAE
jgi:death-on-curing family protein